MYIAYVYICAYVYIYFSNFSELKCLQVILADESKALEEDCKSKLEKRIEMFRNAAPVRVVFKRKSKHFLNALIISKDVITYFPFFFSFLFPLKLKTNFALVSFKIILIKSWQSQINISLFGKRGIEYSWYS